MDFSLIHRADVRQHEFADLCGVTRVTVNLWVQGKMMPHRFIRAHIETALDGVAAALESAQLPLPPSIPKHQRLQALRTAVAPAAQLQ